MDTASTERNRATERTRILVYDDDKSYCKLMTRSGTWLGLDVTTCDNIDEFCRNILENKFEIAIIDYNLDDLKGPEVAKAVEDKPTYVISNTPLPASEVRRWGKDVQGFFCKTTTASDILKAVTGRREAVTGTRQ